MATNVRKNRKMTMSQKTPVELFNNQMDTWIDTGVNLLDPRLCSPDILHRAYDAYVRHILVISSTLDESVEALALCASNNHGDTNAPQNTHKKVRLACTAGIHPHHADKYAKNGQVISDSEQDSANGNLQYWAKLKQLCADKNVSAIGECGLDFNRNFSTQENQLAVFEQQLIIAAELGMGVYLHERDAFDAQFALLQKYASRLKFMVVHCFTGTLAQMLKYLELGCFIGVTGWLCDNKRGLALQEAVKHLPLSRLLLETDAPYLFPKTLRPRKSTNEPCNIPYIGRALAEQLEESEQTVRNYAFKNAEQLFFNER
jgi:TatD DNase family protein